MTSTNEKVQVEWLVACLSPGDVAPHPNFRTDSAHGAELLGLIVQFQWQEYATYRDLLDDTGSDESPERQFLEAARDALDAGPEARQRLLKAAGDQRLSLGVRAAAALFVSSIDSKMDEPEAHLELLTSLAAELERNKRSAPGSRRLAAAVLLQQHAFRSLEAGRLAEALASSEAALSTLADADQQTSWDTFPVSRGISWTSMQSQQRLAELIQANARSLRVSTGDHLDESWTAIVRAPFPAADARTTSYTLFALASVVDDVFTTGYQGLKRIHRSDNVDATMRNLYASLLHAEFAGDHTDVARLRQAIGSVIGVRLSDDPDYPDRYSDAIRLFRQGDSEDHLRRLLQTVRMQGPLEKLQAAAEALTDMRDRQDYVTTSDLALLERSADVISDTHTDRAIKIALRYTKQRRTGRVKSSRLAYWKILETSLKVTGALIAGNSRADMDQAANEVIDLIDSVAPRSLDYQMIFSALAELTTSIQWDHVSTQSRRRWHEMLNRLGESPNTLASDYLRALRALDVLPPPDIEERLRGHEFVAALVGGLLGDSPKHLHKAVSMSVEALESIRRDAEVGKYVGYGWPPMVLAAHLITKFARADVWPPMVATLIDPMVPNGDKFNALQVLTDAGHIDVPAKVVDQLTAHPIPRTRDHLGPSLLSVPEDEFDVACRNLYMTLGLITPSEAQSPTLRDVGTPNSDVRIQASQTCLLAAIQAPHLEWPLILLLQQSYDRDSRVRNSAAEALAYLSVISNISLIGAVRDRVSNCLTEPGIAIAMGALQGLLRVARHDRAGDSELWCLARIRSMTTTHPSRSIRKAARAVIDSYSPPG